MKDHKTRAHALLSASSAHRWLACPPSAVAAELYKDTGSEYAAEGTLAHEVAEWVASGQSVHGPALEKGQDDGVTGEMLEHARSYSDYISELKKGSDAVVLLEKRVDFSDWVPDGFGTCDCILLQDRTLTIIDYKYGVGVPVSAVRNPQMMLYALGAFHDYGFALDVETVEMHIFQPRIDNISVDKISLSDLLAWGDEVVVPTAQLAKDGKGDYKPGAHCKFCPHAGRCKALTALCTEKVSARGLRAKVPVLAPYEVAEVLELEPLVTLWLKRVKQQALDDLMSGKEIPGYKVVEGRLGNRKWTDEDTVTRVLLDAGFSQEAITETKLLSPSAMDKALGAKKIAPIVSELVSREPGSPAVVPESDKRPPLDRLAAAQDDFKN